MTRSATASLLLALGTSGLAGALLAVHHSREWPIAADLGLAIGAFVVALIAFKFCVDWWKTADEAVREAHKFAWYWGGSLGMGVALGAAIVMTKDGELPSALMPLSGDAGIFFSGVLFCGLCQMVGYTIGWAGWWLKRR